jgi:hypothetical protein
VHAQPTLVCCIVVTYTSASPAVCLQGITPELASDISLLVQQATSANLPDVLRVLTGYCSQAAVLDLLTRALAYDKDCVHLLYPYTFEGAGKQGTDTAAGTKSDAPAGPSLSWQQDKPTMTLLQELLGSAMALSSLKAVRLLCNVPSASSLGEYCVLLWVCHDRMLACGNCLILTCYCHSVKV